MDVAMAEPGEILPERTLDQSTYDKLLETKTTIQELVSQMLSIKKEATPKSQLPELVTQTFLHFVTLRQVNRAILLEEDRVKSETERAKAPVDFTTLQLQNLMYEKNHYLKAIKACKDFKSKYPDIELVPEEEFFRDAPEDIKSSVVSKDDDNAHNLMLRRLNYELYQRKELCKLREKLEQQKKTLQETIATRRKFLSSLPSHLKSLRKASLPVQQQLGVLHTKKMKQHQLAELLPPPLYVIYSQFITQKEAFEEKIDLEIVGSVKDAQSFARQQANKDNAISTNLENSKLEDDVPDDDDDGQRRRKRPKKVPSKDNLDQAGIYQNHPLKVILHIHDDEASDANPAELITLRFEYLIKLNVVCVGVEGSQEGPQKSILCNLFPDDTGLDLPHQSAKLCIGDAVAYDEGRTLRPYKWAQHLAGIDFLPEVSPLLGGSVSPNDETSKHALVSSLSLYRQENRVQTVVQRVRARKKSQLALAEQFDSLVKLKWPALTCQNVPWSSHIPQCSLHSWSQVASTPIQASPSNISDLEQAQSSMDLIIDGKPGTSKEEVETTREDGELPSSAAGKSANSATKSTKITPSKGSDIGHSRTLSFLSRNIISPMSKGKSPSFKKQEEDLDLVLDSDSEWDDPTQTELQMEDSDGTRGPEMSTNSWADNGMLEYCLILSRKLDSDEKSMRLEAKIKISMEYPLRPSVFALSLYAVSSGESYIEVDSSEWYNQLRAMEAEVNVYMMNALPIDQDNLVLAHQVRCLAMLFDFYLASSGSTSEQKKSTSVVDVGLCEPTNGWLIARSFRGRDRRKLISWKDKTCSHGYPY